MKAESNSATQVLSPAERDQLDSQGYLELPGIVSAEDVSRMRSRIGALLAITPQEHAGTLIVGGLIEEPLFDPVWSHPRVLAAIAHVLSAPMRLVGVSLRGLRSNHGQQALHVDWGGQGVPGIWYSCHAIFALSDFTAANGATRVIPGSHRNPWLLKGVRDLRGKHPQEKQLVGPAGSVFILNVHCFHSAVNNASDEPRMGIFSNYSRRDSPLLEMTPAHQASEPTLGRLGQEAKKLLM
jgi:hypothetical protein